MKPIRSKILAVAAGALTLLLMQNAMAQWTGVDLGGPAYTGSVTTSNSLTVIKAGGADIWGASDQCHYYYQASEAAVWTATVRVHDLRSPGNEWGKCELMVRNDQGSGLPTANDAFIASMTTQPSSYTSPGNNNAAGVNWVVDQFRTAPGGNADWIHDNLYRTEVTQNGPAGTPAPNYPNRWLRVVRNFSLFYIQHSDNGTSWQTSALIDTEDPNAQPAGADNGTRFTVPFAPKAFIGVAVTSHNNGTDTNGEPWFATAVISDLTFVPTFVPGDTTPPPVPTGLVATTVGSRRVVLDWDDMVDGESTNRVFYNIFRSINGGADVAYKKGFAASALNDNPGAASPPGDQLPPGATVTYKIESMDVNMNKSAQATITVNLPPEVPSPGYFLGQVFTNVGGTVIWDWWYNDLNYPNNNQKWAWWLTGLSFGNNTAFGNTLGDNYGFRFTGTLTAPKTGQYRFFVRSDDSSQFFFNSTGPSLPNPADVYPIAQEDDCCDAFAEPGQDGNVDTGGLPTGTYPTSEPVSLTAGQRYGFVWLTKEGGGGDWGQVAWRMEGDTTPANQLPAIGGVYVTPSSGAALADAVGSSVTITNEPPDTTIGLNSPFTLSVGATTANAWGYPAAYQWYKDGVAMMNANAASLTTDAIDASWNGVYKVVVSVPGASATSRDATVTTTPDVTLPTLVDGSAHGNDTFNAVTFRFSEPVTTTATAPGNYTIAGLNVSAATQVDPYTVRLTTSTQTPATVYTILVRGVQDRGGNTILPDSPLQFKSFIDAPLGRANIEFWDIYTAAPNLQTFLDQKVGGGANPPTLYTPPTRSFLVNYFESPSWENGGNYGAAISGYFIPPQDGDYVFFATSDDQSWLMLSTDENPANKKKITNETSWSSQRNWLASEASTASQKRSDTYTGTEWPGGAPAVITLTGGQRYFMQAVWQEGGGGDGFGATYKLASEADSVTAGAPRLTGNVIQALKPVDPWVGTVTIMTQPSGSSVAKGATATMSVVAGDGARPITYQWQKIGDNGVWQNLAGATAASIDIPDMDATKVGLYRVNVINPAGTATSRPVMLTLNGSFLIEIEDFNYGGGQYKTNASIMPYTTLAYRDLGAVYQVDYDSNNGFDSNSYRARQVVVGGVTNVNFIDGHNVNQNENGGDYRDRGGWFVDTNYKLGWTGGGKWQNYTRDIPAGNYMVYLGASHGDGAGTANRTQGRLGLVTGDTTTTNQTYAQIGVFNGGATGGWGPNTMVPMQGPTTNGVTEVVSLGGLQTLRLYSDNGDQDFLMLIPAAATAPPTIEVGMNTQGQPVITFTDKLYSSDTVDGTYAEETGAVSPFTVTGGSGNAKFYRAGR